MNANQATRLATFLEALEKASRETGITIHCHGGQMQLDHLNDALPLRLNRTTDSDSYSRYVIEAPL